VAEDRERIDFARTVPKAEIHLHLEGSVDLETLLRILRSRREPAGPEARERLEALYHHRDFPHFLRNFRSLCAEIRRPEDFGVLAASLSSRLEADGVRYAEVFVSPSIFAREGPSAGEILDAVSAAARRREAEGGPTLRFLLDGVRQFGVGALEGLVEEAHALRDRDVIGIGVGGDERACPTRVFGPVYREARRLGLHTTIHAGEFDGPRSVWEALEELEVERIGHGVRAAEDAVLMRALARYGRPLECCPSSNLATGVVRSWEDHPIRALHAAGVPITVNSDDPALFRTSIAEEWAVLETRLGLPRSAVMEIGLRTVRASFQEEDGKRALSEAMLRAAADAGVEA
jgi:aminodeoxyfutalosine deaminase